MAEPLTERDLQIQVMDYLKWALADGAVAFHVPMGGSRNRLEAINLKRMGTTAGVPDIEVLYRGRAYFVELKLGKKGALSDSQKHMISRIEGAGCRVAVCRSLEEVKVFLRECGVPMRTESLTTERIRRGFTNAEAAE